MDTRTSTGRTTLNRDPVLLLTSLLQQLQVTSKILMPNVSYSSLPLLVGSATNKTTDGGYQNYVALWYQSLMYQQQQGGQGAPPAGAPAPGA